MKKIAPFGAIAVHPVSWDLDHLAEKQGFEPWLEHDPTNGFRNRPLQPLGYFSKFKVR